MGTLKIRLNVIREGLCPWCKIHRGGLCPHCKIHMGEGGLCRSCKLQGENYVHLYKNEQGWFCPGGILSPSCQQISYIQIEFQRCDSFFHIPYNHILLYFSSGRAHKNYRHFVIFWNWLQKFCNTVKWHQPWWWCISVDLNQMFLKFLNNFLKHDINELSACSGVVNLALLRWKHN